MTNDSKLIFEAFESKFLQSKGVETYAVNQLEKMIKDLENISSAVHLSKSSHLDQLLSKVRDTAEMLMSERGSGTSEENAEDSAEDKMRDRENERDEKTRDAEVSAAFHYDPMEQLSKTAHQIRDILQGAANDEARTEHIINMAQTILGSPKDYNPNEYRKMLDGLIVLLNRFIVVPMN
ncbi:MAG: hypothetical protein EBU90_22600 [Proteobacteria bacterium]|nr:hypothetical protein [Pseudomonadota bacterium]